MSVGSMLSQRWEAAKTAYQTALAQNNANQLKAIIHASKAFFGRQVSAVDTQQKTDRTPPPILPRQPLQQYRVEPRAGQILGRPHQQPPNQSTQAITESEQEQIAFDYAIAASLQGEKTRLVEQQQKQQEELSNQRQAIYRSKQKNDDGFNNAIAASSQANQAQQAMHQRQEAEATALLQQANLKLITTPYDGSCMFHALKAQISPNHELYNQSVSQLRVLFAEAMNKPALRGESEYADQEDCAFAGQLLDRPVVLLNRQGVMEVYKPDGSMIIAGDGSQQGTAIAHHQPQDIHGITQAAGLKDPLYFYYVNEHYMGAKPKAP